MKDGRAGGGCRGCSPPFFPNVMLKQLKTLKGVEHYLLFITRKYTTIKKYIHFIQSTFISVDTQPFASNGIL